MSHSSVDLSGDTLCEGARINPRFILINFMNPDTEKKAEGAGKGRLQLK